MSGRRRIAMIIIVGAIVWLGGILLWASRPLNDSVPVGIDFNLKTPREVSQHVDCNSVFAASARPPEVLPALPSQPPAAVAAGAQPLAYQREPCQLVQDQARILVVVNGVVVAALIGLAAALVLRSRPVQPPTPQPAAA